MITPVFFLICFISFQYGIEKLGPKVAKTSEGLEKLDAKLKELDEGRFLKKDVSPFVNALHELLTLRKEPCG